MDNRSLLAVFPGVSDAAYGGIQVTGRLAMQAIKDKCAGSLVTARFFSFSNQLGDQVQASHDLTVAKSKAEAVVKSLRYLPKADLVLIWHVGLLKLLPLLRRPNSRAILFLHGTEAWRPLDYLTRRILKQVDLVLCNSDHTWKRFLRYNGDFAHIKHLTVLLGIGEPALPDSSGPDGTPTALMIGRMLSSENYKGHSEIIQAWPAVRARIPGAQLWIAGDGDLRPQLELLVRERGLFECTRFWGRITEDRKQELLGQCRFLAMPSRSEGFGLVYAEAMRMGRPCLVSNLDAGSEIVNPPEAGLAVNPEDETALVKAICQLLTPGITWEIMSRNAWSLYSRNFTASRFQERLLTALEPYLR